MVQDKKRRWAHVCTCVTCEGHPYSRVAQQHRAINRVLVILDEKNRRRFIGLLALQWGRGALRRLVKITGLSRNTIRRGREEVQYRDQVPADRVRQMGGGRQAIEKKGLAF